MFACLECLNGTPPKYETLISEGACDECGRCRDCYDVPVGLVIEAKRAKKKAPVAQLVEASPLNGEGSRFES